jgi:glycosyltransferase involved in cell wall biosynthesis
VIYIWNAHWSTAGGGEVYSASLAKTLSENCFEVTLIGNVHLSVLQTITDRLGIDIRGMNYQQISSESEIDKLVGFEDLFINASYGSQYVPKTKRSIFICHFPVNSKTEKVNNFRNILEPVKVVSQCNKSALVPFIAGECLVVENVRVQNPQKLKLDIDCVKGSLEVLSLKGRRVMLEAGDSLKATNEEDLNIESIGNETFFARIREDSKQFARIRTWTNAREEHFSRYYTEIWSNSKFTREHVRERWGVESFVVYPPVRRVDKPVIQKTPNQIISVGRFMSKRSGHSKNQLEMIKAFQKLCKRSSRKWSLFLVGGVQDRDYNYYLRVLEKAKHSELNIHVIPNCPMETLDQLRSSSSIYWHATGLISSKKKPERMEHFGIAVVEALLARCVPLVHDSAGPAEILESFPNLRYNSLEDLVDKTIDITKQETDKVYLSSLSKHGESFLQFENVVLSRVKNLL